MNIVKIQTDMLKAILQKDGKGYKYETMEKITAVIKDAVEVYFIKNEDFFIDLSKWINSESLHYMDKHIFSYEGDAHGAVLTNEVKRAPNKKNLLVAKIKSDDGVFAWIDERKLALFEKNATFKVLSEKDPVYVYEDDDLVGAIFPVNVGTVTGYDAD